MLNQNWPMNREALLAIIDHTLLTPETTLQQCTDFIADARRLGVRRVCISPTLLHAEASGSRANTELELVTVVGFPSGAHTAEVKAFEAKTAVAAGASEIDVVANLNFIMSGDYRSLESELSAVRAATTGRVLKVILETACLSDEQIRSASLVARDAGLDFVKTSTGFHPAGGASVHAVTILSATVGDQLGVKASGGIRTANDASAMLSAGATRLGLSATRQILDEWDRTEAHADLTPHPNAY